MEDFFFRDAFGTTLSASQANAGATSIFFGGSIGTPKALTISAEIAARSNPDALPTGWLSEGATNGEGATEASVSCVAGKRRRAARANSDRSFSIL